jgi:hypothetical protein
MTYKDKNYMKKYYIKNKKNWFIYNKKYRTLNRKKCNMYNKQYKERNRTLILQIYSNGFMKCNHCGYDNVDALTIDHIKNNGSIHRKRLGGSAYFYLWLLKNNFPSGYQILCHNCQWLKELNWRNRNAIYS